MMYLLSVYEDLCTLKSTLGIGNEDPLNHEVTKYFYKITRKRRKTSGNSSRMCLNEISVFSASEKEVFSLCSLYRPWLTLFFMFTVCCWFRTLHTSLQATSPRK